MIQSYSIKLCSLKSYLENTIVLVSASMSYENYDIHIYIVGLALISITFENTGQL